MNTDVIAQLVDGIDLGENEARDVMNEIMTGQSTPAQIAACLTALRMKGETLDELVGVCTCHAGEGDTALGWGTTRYPRYGGHGRRPFRNI